MKEEEIEVAIEENTLTLRGEEARQGSRGGPVPSHRAELWRIRADVALPPTVDADKVKAEYKAGVLTGWLPLREEAKPRRSRSQSPRKSLQRAGSSHPASLFA